ncbi:MAG TPA: LLM class flavin-dependent oxidoreductase [Polyangiaceae bacterium]|jgi:luciferase family oxidoreductase group 1|nr:LLM class flavin-dependent oxidoreductase [Polyangiaceae bacterium]
MSRAVPLSILDLAFIGPGQTVRDAFAASVALARTAERLGYRRVWYAEHHNMPTIGSSATSVLIEHVASKTSTIRVGAGGIMLPNHPPLVIAEQFGTLEALHPGRIDLGLGRAPGTDPVTSRALRRSFTSADTFPDDVLELQAYLAGETRLPGVHATPGRGAKVPLYILGSSLFGARLAAVLGLPYAFASHFAPQALEEALALYRRDFRSSAQLAAPYAIAGITVIASDSAGDAEAQLAAVQRVRARSLLAQGRPMSDAEADVLLASPGGAQLKQMMTYAAVGTPDAVGAYVAEFAALTRADELMTVHPSPALDARLRSVELLAGPAPP